VLVDRETGNPLAKPQYDVAAGPAASETLRLRYPLRSEASGTALIERPTPNQEQ